MENKIIWNGNNTITSLDNRQFKKITGTKFASILGKNPYSTEFEIWCDLTHVYIKQIEPTKYTTAGNIIEPKQAIYCKDSLGMNNLITPSELYGKNYFNKLRGNFFTDEIFGGMWDYLLLDTQGNPQVVLEMKTTKNVSNWKNDIPEYYALQAALYAYLLGVEQIYMVATFLLKDDYNMLDVYTPTKHNTSIYPFRLHERYPDFEVNYIDKVKEWYYNYVVTKTSPVYDEVKDKDIIEAIKQKFNTEDNKINLFGDN